MVDPLTIGLLAYLLTLGRGKKTADRLEYFPKNVEIIHGKLVATMEILNPTGNKLKIDSFFGGVTADDKKIGSIEQGKEFTLAPKTRTSVQFPVKLSTLGALQILLSKTKLKNMKWKLVGVARALGIDNPVSQEISFNV